MKFLLLLDADNTIWDTDSLFSTAQVSMLRQLRQYDFALSPDEDLVALRAIDRELSQRLGTPEYDFCLLARSLIEHSRGLPIDQAIDAVADGREIALGADRQALEAAARAFYKVLSQPAKLFPGVLELLDFLKEQRQKLPRELAVVLVSEGRRDRVLRTINYYRLNGHGRYFDCILFGKKGIKLLTKAKIEGAKVLQALNPKIVVVGDSIQADIKPGNLIGAITVYKPSCFLGEEVPSVAEERPSYKISNLTELIPILRAIIVHGDECLDS